MYLAINKHNSNEYHSFVWNEYGELIINWVKVNPNDWIIIEVFENIEKQAKPIKKKEKYTLKDIEEGEIESFNDFNEFIERWNEYYQLEYKSINEFNDNELYYKIIINN
jgi:hypothetical protein